MKGEAAVAILASEGHAIEAKKLFSSRLYYPFGKGPGRLIFSNFFR